MLLGFPDKDRFSSRALSNRTVSRERPDLWWFISAAFLHSGAKDDSLCVQGDKNEEKRALEKRGRGPREGKEGCGAGPQTWVWNYLRPFITGLWCDSSL